METLQAPTAVTTQLAPNSALALYSANSIRKTEAVSQRNQFRVLFPLHNASGVRLQTINSARVQLRFFEKVLAIAIVSHFSNDQQQQRSVSRTAFSRHAISACTGGVCAEEILRHRKRKTIDLAGRSTFWWWIIDSPG